jgi:hypothetical protein
MTLLAKGESWRLWVEPVGRALVAKAEIHVGRGSGAGTRIVLDGSEAPIPVGRWAHVAFSYDRAFAVLEVNRVEVGRFPEEPEVDASALEAEGAAALPQVEPEKRPIVPDPSAPLTVGDSSSPIEGAVDEIRVTAVLSGDVIDLPENVTLDCPVEAIHFKNGWLDPRFHTAPVTFTLRFQGRGRPVTIGLNGLPMQ